MEKNFTGASSEILSQKTCPPNSFKNAQQKPSLMKSFVNDLNAIKADKQISICTLKPQLKENKFAFALLVYLNHLLCVNMLKGNKDICQINCGNQ